jgi:hypothetical protein
VSLSFVAGSAQDVFSADLAAVVDAELRKRFAVPAPDGGEAYQSDAVDGRAWVALQERVPELAPIDPYQAVFIPAPVDCVTEVALPNVADPLVVCSLDGLMTALLNYAKRETLPTDDVELMQLAAHYLENEEEDADLHVQIYVQLMQTAKQAVAHGQPLWLVV